MYSVLGLCEKSLKCIIIIIIIIIIIVCIFYFESSSVFAEVLLPRLLFCIDAPVLF